MSHEQRRSDRKTPEGIVPVVNSITGEQIGHIGNISVEGLMLISRGSIEAGLMFQIGFALPHLGEEKTFNVGAICLWCSEASAPNTYWSGFEIMDCADDDALALKTILTEL